MTRSLGVFAAGAATLTRSEHAGNEGILPSTEDRMPSFPGCFMQARAA